MAEDEATLSTLTVLFWNLHQQDRTDLVCALAKETLADVVVLAENGAAEKSVTRALRERVREGFFAPSSEPSRIQCFARDSALGLTEVYADANGRVTARILNVQNTEILLFAAHLRSKKHRTELNQGNAACRLGMQIRSEEARQGHTRTIVVGDLNMNPFEPGVVQASGLHAVSTKTAATAGTRTVDGQSYPFFYNPMWRFFGDWPPGPPGTYHRGFSDDFSHDWNVFDQVLVRPSLLPWWDDDVEVVTTVEDTNLLKRNGRPNQMAGSDHLPVVFRLVAVS